MITLLIAFVCVFIYSVVGITVFSIAAPRIAWNASRQYSWQTGPDSGDKTDGQYGGFLLGVFWPATIPGFLLYVLAKHAVLSTFKVLRKDNFWDEPKPIQSPIKTYRENKMVKREHQVAQQREAVTEQRKIINARERELGFDLTEWDDFPVNNYDRITR